MIRARAIIDRDALAHNLSRVRALAPHSRVYAAVKADGYGHGAVTVAGALAAALQQPGVMGNPAAAMAAPSR